MTQSSSSPQPRVSETTPNWDLSSRRRARYYLAAALLLAILAGLATYGYLDDVRQHAVPTGQALVARQNIRAGEVVRPEAIDVRAVPQAIVPMGALTDASQAIGRTAAVTIEVGEVLLPGKLISEGGGGLSSHLPDGRWAMVLPVGWLISPVPELTPGDHLDLLGYQRGELQSDAGLVVSAVEVIVVQGDKANAERLTLAVTMDEATAILLARTNGLSLLALLRPGGV